MLESRCTNLKRVTYLVLDEADRMCAWVGVFGLLENRHES